MQNKQHEKGKKVDINLLRSRDPSRLVAVYGSCRPRHFPDQAKRGPARRSLFITFLDVATAFLVLSVLA
jgi:hypothetical protein